MFLNKGFVLASRPDRAPQPENFRLVTSEMDEPAEGEVIVCHYYLSLDPYMRERMNAAKSYGEPQKLDEIMIGATVGEIVATKNSAFEIGDRVADDNGGWQLYAKSDGKNLRKIMRPRIPIQAFLGPLGMPGVAAWYGINAILAPKKGEVVVVSAATGGVGTVAGQLAKMEGARVIGIAGSEAKCKFATEVLGYDLCLDHHAPDFERRFAQAVPNGINAVFENTGGKPLEVCLKHLKDFARVAMCGLIASGYDGTLAPMPDMRPIIGRRCKIEGFVIFDHLRLWPQVIEELTDYLENDGLAWSESVVQGLEAAPEAFIGMLQGKNFGKQMVKLV